MPLVAVEHDGCVLLGDHALDLALEDAAREVVGARDVAARPLRVLAHVEQDVALTRLQPIHELVDGEQAHALPRVLHELLVSRRVGHEVHLHEVAEAVTAA